MGEGLNVQGRGCGYKGWRGRVKTNRVERETNSVQTDIQNVRQTDRQTESLVKELRS